MTPKELALELTLGRVTRQLMRYRRFLARLERAYQQSQDTEQRAYWLDELAKLKGEDETDEG